MYFVYMGLLIVTIILWAIIALRPDVPEDDSQKKP